MKNTVLSLSLLIMAGIMLTCSQASAMCENNKGNKNQMITINLTEFSTDSIKVLRDTTVAYQNFIKKSEEMINTNQKNIADLKVKIHSEKNVNKIDQEKQLAMLEGKNNDMKKKLQVFNNTESNNWLMFKSEFNYDMKNLGKAIDDFTKNYNK